MNLHDVFQDAMANLKTGRKLFCGLTANVDIVVFFEGDDFLRAQERFGSDPAAGAEPPSSEPSTPAEALDHAAWFMANGTGGEANMPSIRPLLPLVDALPNSRVVGGTGAQAANWLAGSGFENVILYVPRNAPDFDGLLHPNMRTLDNNREYAELMGGDREFSEIHCIIDYARGTNVRYGGTVRGAGRHDRLILSGDRCLSRLRVSKSFQDAACAPHDDSALLVTGFNSCRAMDDFSLFLDQCAALMDRYHEANPGGFIHAEECFQWDHPRERRRALAETIWPRSDSLGMNEAEYRDICGQFGLDAADARGSLLELARRYGLRRVCRHNSTNCLTVTRYPEVDELRAAGLAVLFSGARAFYGDFTERDGIDGLIRATRDISENAPIPGPVQLDGGYLCIEVPTLKGMPIKSSIGLGDAFTAGLIAYF